MDDYDYLDESSGIVGFWANLPPGPRASVVFAIPFIAVDIFNYFSAGAALVISLPLLALIYAACGAVAAKYAAEEGRDRAEFPFVGATGGFALWVISLVVGTIVSLVIGAASLGTTLILGLPYICLCAPGQLIAGGLMGALGAWLYKTFGSNEMSEWDDETYW